MAKVKKKSVNPKKKTDDQLIALVEQSIRDVTYVFTKHAKQRSEQRAILESIVLDILENKANCRRRRNKGKDSYEKGAPDWKYCFEGEDPDGATIRIIITFEQNLMPIITVMWTWK